MVSVMQRSFYKVLLIVDGRYWCGFCDAVFFDNVLLIVDGRYWCGFCDAAFFDKVLLIVDGRQGQIQHFKLGGVHLKKLRRAEGGAKILGYLV